MAQSPIAYATWIATVELLEDAMTAAPAVIGTWPVPPSFSVIVHDTAVPDRKALDDLIQGLTRQGYPSWELIVVPSTMDRGWLADLPHAAARVASTSADTLSEALAIGIGDARGDYIIPLQAGVTLSPIALYRYAEAVRADPDVNLIYGDHDHIDAQGRRSRPWFKPRWNEEMFFAQDYMSGACAIRTETARRAMSAMAGTGSAALYALLLRVARNGRVAHIPHVLAHCRFDASEPADRLLAVRHAIADIADGCEAVPGPFDTIRVQWPLPATLPLVSIIVPTRDQVALLRACIEGVLHRTSYGPIEVIVVDNGSTDPAALAYFDELRGHPDVRILSYDRPYNYSEINNFAVAHARGEYLCLLNNDTEVIDENWLTELMRHAVRPHVGAVGAMLLYDDGSIQHAGVVIGMGQAAGHAHRFLKRGDAGYFRYAHVPHYASAVTAACLVIARSKFDAVGGLDERNLAIAFNDVDLCLKLQEAGWRNLYAPQAVLVHHESKSRGKDFSPQHIERYRRELSFLQKRWGTVDYMDPVHHPHLDASVETFLIRLQDRPVAGTG